MLCWFCAYRGSIGIAIIFLFGFDVSMKTGLAPRGSTFTILPPAVVMAANNYYGLPQVPDRMLPIVETLI